MEKRIKNCLDQDFSPNGLSAEEISKAIGSNDINQVEQVINNMFNNGSLIKYTHENGPDIKFRTQKSGQDLLGQQVI